MTSLLSEHVHREWVRDEIRRNRETYAPAARRSRLTAVRLRASDDAKGVIAGYASVFDVHYKIGRDVLETIKPGAFTDSLKHRGGVVPFFLGHDWTEPLGVVRASEDSHGLKVRAEVFMDTEKGRSVWRSAKAGSLKEWSIGFRALTVRDSEKDGFRVEEILEADLLEASVVLVGANPATSTTSVRSI